MNPFKIAILVIAIVCGLLAAMGVGGEPAAGRLAGVGVVATAALVAWSMS